MKHLLYISLFLFFFSCTTQVDQNIQETVEKTVEKKLNDSTTWAGLRFNRIKKLEARINQLEDSFSQLLEQYGQLQDQISANAQLAHENYISASTNIDSLWAAVDSVVHENMVSELDTPLYFKLFAPDLHTYMPVLAEKHRFNMDSIFLDNCTVNNVHDNMVIACDSISQDSVFKIIREQVKLKWE